MRLPTLGTPRVKQLSQLDIMGSRMIVDGQRRVASWMPSGTEHDDRT
jgi:hypothetical protein